MSSGAFSHKKQSGAANRKAKKRKTEEDQAAAKSLGKWLKLPATLQEDHKAIDPPIEAKNNIAETNITSDNVIASDGSIIPSRTDLSCTVEVEVSAEQHTEKLLKLSATFPADDNISIDSNDIGTYPEVISDSLRLFLIENEPKWDYSALENSIVDGRRLTSHWFFRTMNDGKKKPRKWLVYSPSKDSLFCLPCLLFGTCTSKSSNFLRAGCGIRNWKHLSDKIPTHENNPEHKDCFIKWRNLQFGLTQGSLIDHKLQNEINCEKQRWRHLLKIILDAVLYLSTNNLAFRGKVEKIGSPSSGNFLSLIELLSHYDPVLKQHLEKKSSFARYLHPDIQNEFIGILSSSLRNTILSEVKQAKYFSIMFDCTPDTSHKEQMSEIIRYVSCNQNGCEIKESFIEFIITEEKTGEYLAAEILDKIKSDGLSIEDCRGQCYDNGANMKGKNKGVQARIVSLSKLARYSPCLGHSLNLAGVHAASTNTRMKSFFGLLQRVFVFFSGSVNRWSILQENTRISLKASSDTRWSAKAEAVGSLCAQLPDVCKALSHIENNSHIPEYISDAKTLLKQICDFEFIVTLNVWNQILSNINTVNKIIQGKTISVGEAAEHLDGLTTSLKEIRVNGFSIALKESETTANIIQIPAKFKEGIIRRKKRMPGEQAFDDACGLSKEKHLRIDICGSIDRIINDCSEIMRDLKEIAHDFEFLIGKNLAKMSEEELRERARLLSETYTTDLIKIEFILEITSFKHQASAIIQDLTKASALDLLNMIYARFLDDIYPNVETALRIYLTLPVTVASCERSFSKLKLVKTYLRSTMAQERLSGLALLSIEHQMAKKINFDSVIDEFAARKARKVPL